MKKLMLMLALASLAVAGANAWEVALTTNATATMVAPPAKNLSYRQIAERSATNVVAMGDIRREGLTFIVAANAGTTGTNVTTRTYSTNDVAISYTVATNLAALGTAVSTNTVVAVAPLVVPDTGLSAVDGSVYWFRVPKVGEFSAEVIQPYITASASVYFTDVYGNKLTESTSMAKTTLAGQSLALYGRASDTNCSVSVFPIR